VLVAGEAKRGKSTLINVLLGTTVNASGGVSIGNHIISAGLPVAGQRIAVRLDGPVAHILSGGTLARSVAWPVPPPSPRHAPPAATSDGTRHRTTVLRYCRA